MKKHYSTRRPLSTGIFSAFLVDYFRYLAILVTRSKNFQVTKSQIVDGDLGHLAEFGKKRHTDYDFPPPLYVGGK